MRKRRIEMSEVALADLAQLKAYLALDSLEVADRIMSLMYDAASTLETFSERCPVVYQEPGEPPLRALYVMRWAMLYRVIDDLVFIAGVCDASQDYRSKLADFLTRPNNA